MATSGTEPRSMARVVTRTVVLLIVTASGMMPAVPLHAQQEDDGARTEQRRAAEPLAELELPERGDDDAALARPRGPVVGLWSSGIQSPLVFTGVTLAAGLAGAVAGAIAGLMSSVVIGVPAALSVRFGQLPQPASAVAIQVFFVAPVAMAVVGGMSGYLLARLVAAALAPLPEDAPSSSPRSVRLLAFAAIDVGAHLLVFTPLLLLTAGVGVLTGVISALTLTQDSVWMSTNRVPSRMQVGLYLGTLYAAAAAVVLWPTGAALVQSLSPTAAMLAASMAPSGAGHE